MVMMIVEVLVHTTCPYKNLPHSVAAKVSSPHIRGEDTLHSVNFFMLYIRAQNITKQNTSDHKLSSLNLTL